MVESVNSHILQDGFYGAACKKQQVDGALTGYVETQYKQLNKGKCLTSP